MRRTLALALLLLAGSAAQEDDGEWVQHYDKASGKPFYYHSKTRESAWEPPVGAKVKYSEEGATSGGSSESSKKDAGLGAGWVMMAMVLPILLPFIGLFFCYWSASKEGLADALKAMKKTRDRSAKRRGASSGGGFRQRAKLSQDGKGGRSANS